MEIFKGLLGLSQQVALFFAVYLLARSVRARWPLAGRLTLGTLFVASTFATMEGAVPLGGGVFADMRGALLLCSTLFGGKLIGGLTLAFAEAYRLQIGGGGMWAGLVGNALASAVGLGLLVRNGNRETSPPTDLTSVLAGAALVVATTNFSYLFIQPWDAVLPIWKNSALAISLASLFTSAALAALLQFDARFRESLAFAEIGRQHLQQVIEATRVGIWDWQAQSGAVDVNARWAEMIGYSLDELRPITIETWRKFAHPDDLRKSDESLEPVMAGKVADYSCDVRMRHKNGHWVWIRDSGRVTERDDAGQASRMVGTHLDITELMQANEAIEATARRYRAIVRSAPDGIVTVDADMRILSFNPEAVRLFKYAEADVIGKPLDMLIPAGERAGHAHLARRFMEDRREGSRAMADWRTVWGVRADGQSIPLMVTLSLTHENGNPLAIAIVRDMTVANSQRQLLNDLNVRLEQKLIEAEEANRAKTRFLATMSHELRTPLNSIIGFADYLRNESYSNIPDDKKREYLGDIAQSGNHLLSLINDLLDLARIEQGKRNVDIEPVDIRGPLKQAFRLSRSSIRNKGVSLRWHVSPLDLTALADRRALLQVALNVVSNAVKFVPDQGGSIRVRASLHDANTVRITIEDNGCGIPHDRIADLGKPFVQVGNPMLSETRGAGLGLAICKQLLGQMHGTLTIESELGRWTRISIDLPSA